jgi:hypothetical protein
MPGIKDFKQRRQLALYPSPGFLTATFHDGIKVLPAVLEWHEELRRYTRVFDTITGQLLDLIEQHLLQFDPQLRLGAGQVHTLLMQILRRAKEVEQRPPDEIRMVEELNENDEELYDDVLPSTQDMQQYFEMAQFETFDDFGDSAIGLEPSAASNFSC